MLYLGTKVILLFAFRDFFIIYFYICGVNTDCVKDMQTLLNDIELDIQELKCLMQAILKDANPALRIVAKRNIQQMRARLDALQKMLDEATMVAESVSPVAPVAYGEVFSSSVEPTADCVAGTVLQQPVDGAVEPASAVITPASSILAERIKPATSLRHAISLNDSFRFTKELFNGDSARMNEVVRLVGEASTLAEAMAVFHSEVHVNDENEAVTDFMELLKKYYS